MPAGCDNHAGTDKAGAMDDMEKRPAEGEASTPSSLYDQGIPASAPGGAPAVEGDEPGPEGPRADAGPAVGLDDDRLDDDVDDDDLDDEFSDDLSAGPTVPAWVGVVSGAGLGLALVQALVLIGTFAQGMAVERFDGDFLHKAGVALLSNVGTANGLILLVAAALAGLPAVIGAPTSEGLQRRRAFTFALVAVLAVVLIVGTPIAVRARVHVLDVSGQEVDSLARRVLATYVAGTLGTALVALGTALGLSRLGRPTA